MPFSRRVFTASRTAVRLTPNCSASSRSGGNWSPGFKAPLWMDSSTCWTICSYSREERMILYISTSVPAPTQSTWALSSEAGDGCRALKEGRYGQVVGPQYHHHYLLASPSFLLPLLDPHRLHVREFPNSHSSQFPSVPGPLRPSKGNPGIGSHHAVNEHHPGIELIDELLLLHGVIGPGAGSQPEPAIVGNSNGVVDVLCAKHAR